MLHLLDLDRSFVNNSEDISKKQKIEEVASVKATYDIEEYENNCGYDLTVQLDSGHGYIGSCESTKQTAEMRLERNRYRARNNQKRNKVMLKVMQKQLIILSTEKNKLRM